MDIVLLFQKKSSKIYTNKIISKKEKANIEIIKNDKIVKLTWVPKLSKKF